MDNVINEVVRALRERVGPRLRRVSLFGSRARGDDRPDSDYDLLVVVDVRDMSVKNHAYEVSWDFLMDRLVSISPKVIGEREYLALRGSSHPFWERLRRDETVLWEAPI